MELYLLKFSACLLVFWLLYLLLLEKQQMHRFKRFYLLGSFVVALVIPQLTIIEYIEPIVQNFEVSNPFIPIEAEFVPQPTNEAPVITLEAVLWTIYTIGVLLFSVRFTTNLYSLYRRISKNSTYKDRNFIYVLLTEYRIPHSFFKYIFVNQSQFENNQIPEEVKLHEETHAKQLHSLDILLLELLQIVFWFHPLVYILKHHVKLNHEFLADAAVLQKGVATKNYQNILLQFSSNTHNHQLASAINYSSFKKRFTVMKTQTSKTRIWLSTLLVLPILAILFYSFAEREYVEKNKTETNSFLVFVEKNGNTLELRCESGCRWSHLVLEPNSEPYIINDFGFSEGKTLDTDKFAFSIEPNQSGVLLNGLKGTAWVDLVFSLPKNQKQAVNQLGMTNETANINEKKVEKVITIKAINNSLYINNKKSNLNDYIKDLNEITDRWTLKDYEHTKFDLKTENCSQSFLDNLNELHKKTNHFSITVLGITEASPKMMKEYNDWIVKFNTTHYIDYSKYQRIVAIYGLMTEKQRSSVEKYPVIPDTNLSKVKPNSPTASEFEDWKNTDKYALWIDGVHVPNSALNSYSISDIVHFVGSKVHKNARSEKFPQPFQFSLYTKDGFRENYQKSAVNHYNAITKKYSNAISNYLKGDQKDNSELKILKAQADKIYNLFTKEELKEHNILPPPPVPAKNSEWQKVENILDQQKPIMWIFINREGQLLVDDEIGTIESIEKKLKKLSKSKNSKGTVAIKFDPETPKETINEVKSIVQKCGFKALTLDINQIPPPPPPPPAPSQKEQKTPTKEEVEEYNTWAKKIKKETLEAKENERNGKPAEYPIIKQKDLVKYVGIYKRMTTEQKQNSVELPIADKELKNTGLKFPPPPPPEPKKPKSTLDFIIKMAKENASFYYDGKSITSDEAIALIKKNDKLNVNAYPKSKEGKPLVYISKEPIKVDKKKKSKN